MSLREIYERNKKVNIITRIYLEARESKVTSIIYLICCIVLFTFIYTFSTGHFLFSFLDLPNNIELSSNSNSSIEGNELSAITTLNESYRWTLSALFQGLSALLGITFAFMLFRMNILGISEDRVAYGWGRLAGGAVPPPPIQSHIGIKQSRNTLKLKIYLLLLYFLITALTTLSGLTFETHFYNNWNLKNNILISSLFLSIGVILLFFDLIYHVVENKVIK